MSSANHPSTQHVCQELHQAIWTVVPAHDLMLAFPCCQGHSRARGKASGNPQHDAIRSTAWSVVSAAEFHSPAFAVIENVPKFPNWLLYHTFLGRKYVDHAAFVFEALHGHLKLGLAK